MVLDLILPILVGLITDPIKKYVVTPIKRHVSYAFKCDSKVQGLQEQVKQLQNKRVRLQQSVDEARRNGEEIYPNVTEWLSSADAAIGDAEELVQQKEQAKTKCLLGLCPNFKTRYQLNKKVETEVLAIDKLRNEEGLDSISFRPPLQQIVGPSVYSREALPSRVSMLNQIMDALRDPSLNMIGVYGMGGVGKTTLAKEVQAKAVQEKLFETVVMVPVSQTPEWGRIQAEIAYFLGLEFGLEEGTGRASRLYNRLENSKVLIILDDLWQKLDLNAIGIPFHDASKGCKIMLTSRNKDLLSSEMGAQKLFSLEALKEEETLSLFEMSVAEAKDPQFHDIATKIAKKCAGLPLLIQVVAIELRNKESYVWNDKLNQLSAFDDEEIYEKVYKVLESSYEALPGKEIKSFFLLCALFGQSNIRIQYLLTHGMGLDLFKHNHTVEGARDKVLTWIDKLRAKSLLLDGDMVGFVKMHDVVRDTALSIASREQHAFIRTGPVTLRDWPNKDCTRISLPFYGISELPVDLDCPEAELFLLFTEDHCLEILDSFFNGIKKLKVVDFTGMCLVSLPSSISLLTNLQTLCLHRCRLDNLAILGELKQLVLLSFADSEIVELPGEMEALTQLKLLDLRNCSNLQVIPAGVLSKLCLLEELYVINSFVRWDAKGNVSLVELESLSHLLTLEIEIKYPKVIPLGFKCFDRLRSYKISIGDIWHWHGKYERSRMLKLKVEAGIHMEDDKELLLRKTEDLYLDGVRGIENVFYEGFPQLQHMHIANDCEIQHLIKSTMWASCNAFPILESLYLNNLQSLEKICDGELGIGSFGELQILKISNCDKLKSLFSCSFAKFLPHLREMEVESCKNIEAIAGEGSEDVHYNNEVIEFTGLSSLKLEKLPHLIGFCKIKGGTEQMGLLFNSMVSFPNLTSLVVRQCNSLKHIFTTSMVSFPNLTSLEVWQCNSLKHIFTTSMAKSLMQLKNLKIESCELVEEIIQSKKMEEIDEESAKIIVFPKLDYLSLEYLGNVKWFSSCYSIEFPSLRELSIISCDAMRNFVSKFSSNESEEFLFNEMVSFSKLDSMRIIGMNNFKYLWDEQFIADDSFFKLKSISIYNCSKLSVVFPSKICTRFQGVEWLAVDNCDGVEEIYQQINLEEIKNAFSLRSLKIGELPSLKHIWNKDACGGFSTFENLQSVYVYSCEDLKYVFPASMGCGLVQLQRLGIGGCNMEVIIAKEKNETSDLSFQFPELTELEFWNLKEMKCLYDGPHTFQCPKLKRMAVEGCSNIFFEKLIPNLEELEIDEQGFHAIHGSGEFSVDLYSKLKNVTLSSLERERSIGLVFCFLRGLKYLEKLVFNSCSLEEIFGLDDALNQRPIREEIHHHLRVKHLELWSIKKLEHITRKKDSQLIHTLQHLQSLRVRSCHNLMNIAPSSTSLQNLTTLHVNNCKNVTNLVTASTAKTMVQLMEMKVVDCIMIEEIITKDGDDTDHNVIIFNKLKRLELNGLRKLKSFCSNNYTLNFPLLEQVTIKGCRRMNIFCGGVLSTPKLRGILFEDEQQWEGNLNTTIASQLTEWVGEHLEEGRVFRNVESLELVNNTFSSKAILADQMKHLNKLREITVRDCESVQVVFDADGLLPKLNYLYLINRPMLSQLCNKAPKGIYDFYQLKVVKIENCTRLKYAFTWSMASCLVHLEEIELKNCEIMESIIIENEEEEEDAVHVTFGSLRKIRILRCPLIKTFISTHIHFTHPVFPELEELSIDIKCITRMMQFELQPNLFSKVKNLQVKNWSATTRSYVPLVHFLSRLPNLVQLRVFDSSFKELFKFEVLNSNFEEAPTVPQIKSLKLENLDELRKIWWQDSQFHASLFQSLEAFEVKSCGNLMNFTSFSTCFQNLATLKVYECNQLMNLITSSMAKNMAQLKELRVESCKMLMEIVGDGSDETTDEIVFTKMKILVFVDLQSLQGFSLRHCNLKFPCLEQVIVRRCPNLRIFCDGIISTPMLNRVREYNAGFYWEGDLNATIKHMYNKMVTFQHFYASTIKLSVYLMLKETWESQFPISFLPDVARLEVDDCELFSNAIPSHLLQHLVSLKVLIVEKCDSMEQVIDLEGLDADEHGINQKKNLEELQLIDLPRLKQVWSKDPQQILSFKNLQLLKVHNCGDLTYIFNLSMGLSFQNLQHVEVKNCPLVEHIIMKAEVETLQKYQTIFPSLKSMNLQHLSKLLSFCSTSGILECPSLKIIEIVDCPNMELFASTFLEGQDSSIIVEERDESVGIEDPNSITAFLGNKIVIPGLEELKVEWDCLKDELNGNYQSRFHSRLKCIELMSFQGKYAILPSTFLHQFPKLEKLSLSDALIEEINLDDLSTLKDKDPESLALLTKLKLSKLPKLKHLVNFDCQSIPLFQNLEDLAVLECSSLKILVPFSVSLQNLTDLEVSKCDGLINLISASTARSLVQLRRMIVNDCKMMQEIVAIASDEEQYEIQFSQLDILALDDLPCLTSFCSRNYDFHFPSLQEVMITECPRMKSFAKQVSVTPKLRKVQTGRKDYDWEWEGSLNNTIQALYMEKVAKETDALNM